MRKTKKAVASRFIMTKSGRIKRSRSGKSHLMRHKTRKRKRSIRKGAYLSGMDEKNIRSMLPHG